MSTTLYMKTQRGLKEKDLCAEVDREGEITSFEQYDFELEEWVSIPVGQVDDIWKERFRAEFECTEIDNHDEWQEQRMIAGEG